MTQQHRTWSGIAKLAAEKFVTRPFANRIAGLVAIAGVIVVVGPPVALLVASKAAAHFWQFDIPVSPPGPLDYAAGLSLVFGALIYSGWIHYVTTLASIKQRQNDVVLEIEFLDQKGKPLPATFQGRLFSLKDGQTIPDYSFPRRGPFDIPSIGENRDYHREWFTLAKAVGNCNFLKFKVRNVGMVSARNLVVKVSFESDIAIEVISEKWLPKMPSQITDFAANLRNIANKADIDVSGNVAGFSVEILNPGDDWFTTTLVGIRPKATGRITATVRMFAEDLPTPIEASFTIEAEITDVELTAQDVVAQKVPKQA